MVISSRLETRRHFARKIWIHSSGTFANKSQAQSSYIGGCAAEDGAGAPLLRTSVLLLMAASSPASAGLVLRPSGRTSETQVIALTRPSLLAGQVFGALLGELSMEGSGGLADFDHVAVGVSHVAADLSKAIDRRRDELGPP